MGVLRVEWEILLTSQVEAFLDGLYETDRDSHRLVNQAILVLEQTARRKEARWSTRSPHHACPTMKELRPPSAGRSEVRILFACDPWRSAVLLIAGDKSGQWSQRYRQAVPEAEQLYGETEDRP